MTHMTLLPKKSPYRILSRATFWKMRHICHLRHTLAWREAGTPPGTWARYEKTPNELGSSRGLPPLPHDPAQTVHDQPNTSHSSHDESPACGPLLAGPAGGVHTRVHNYSPVRHANCTRVCRSVRISQKSYSAKLAELENGPRFSPHLTNEGRAAPCLGSVELYEVDTSARHVELRKLGCVRERHGFIYSGVTKEPGSTKTERGTSRRRRTTARTGALL